MEEKKSFKTRIRGAFDNFKSFAFKDTTLSVAVGLMIGAAIKSVVDSLVTDIMTPPIAKITSGIDFGHLFIVLSREKYETVEAARSAGEVVITYGNFLNALLSFLITALALFLIVSWFGKLSKKEEVKEERKNKTCPYCKSDIPKGATKCAFCTSTVK